MITGNTVQNPTAGDTGERDPDQFRHAAGRTRRRRASKCPSNTLSGAWSALNDDSIRYRHRGAAGSSFRVRNYDGASDIDAFVTGINTFGAGTVDPFGFQLVGANVFTGGTGACSQ